MPVNEQSLRKLSVKVNAGSGCLYQPGTRDYSYVLTVRHNVAEENTHEKFATTSISQPGSTLEYTITAEDVFLHPDVNVDLAIVKIPYIEIGTNIYFSRENRGERLRLFGFPDIKSQEADPVGSLFLTADITTVNAFDVIGEQDFSNYDLSAAATMVGFSGSGIFDENSEVPLLKGIMPRLDAIGGSHNRLKVYHISTFDEIISANGLTNMTPYCLLSFDHYATECFSLYSDELQSVLKKKSAELQKTFNPFAIQDKLKEKLFIPYSAEYADHLLKVELWNGWLTLLCFLWMVDDKEIEIDDVIKLLNGDESIHVRYFHSSNSRMPDIIQQILTDAYETLDPRDNIIVSSDKLPLGQKCFTSEELNKVIINVCAASKAIHSRTSIDIGDPASVKPISVIHLNHFQDQIADIQLLTSVKAFEESIKSKILTYLMRKD